MQSGQRYTRKKITHVNLQRFTFQNIMYTQLFIDYLSAKDPRRLKFFDEAGVKYPDIGTRLYGHAPIGERCIEVVRKVESPNSTVNLIVSLNGPEYYDVIAGATNNIEFLQFFTRGLNAVNPITLRPVLQTGDIVIMDNLSVHHFDAGEVLEEF
ncbi:hypothetical protein QZH41_005162 [Actinostola sp. cb2023]|nr:hypothetical protein QZH41_005162 [Actinostola sp. cb2023]